MQLFQRTQWLILTCPIFLYPDYISFKLLNSHCCQLLNISQETLGWLFCVSLGAMATVLNVKTLSFSDLADTYWFIFIFMTLAVKKPFSLSWQACGGRTDSSFQICFWTRRISVVGTSVYLCMLQSPVEGFILKCHYEVLLQLLAFLFCI